MTERFKKVKKGILDTQTGLIWEKTQNRNKMTWEEAMKYASSLGPGWRLPGKTELFGIIEEVVCNPATKLPGIITDRYWSSITHALSPTSAWYVSFGYGYVNADLKTNAYYVRCVSPMKAD